jgi:hypothetical protein
MQTPELTYFQTTDGEIILLTQKLYEKKDFIGIVLSTNATHQVACEALQDGLSYYHCCSAQQCWQVVWAARNQETYLILS